MYPYVAFRCPTYREISHASHTWHQGSRETACFLVPAARLPCGFDSHRPLHSSLPGVSLRCLGLDLAYRQFPQFRRGYSLFDRMRRAASRSSSLITVLIRKGFNPAIGRWKDWSRARSGQPSPSAKDHTVICAIARFHIINPWSRANAMAWVRDQTPSLSKTLEA
jgi:hypothetical protein